MTEWNEVDIELFKEIFSMYWSHSGDMDNKVIEIQNLNSIYDGNSDIRIFLGAGIKIKDYKPWNIASYQIINMMSSIMKDLPGFKNLDDCELSMCMLEKGPRIIPLGAVGDHFNLILSACFGEKIEENSAVAKALGGTVSPLDMLSLWFYKDASGKYIKSKSSDSQALQGITKLLRIRTFDLDEWKRIVSDYTKNQYKLPESLYKDDVKKENILKI